MRNPVSKKLKKIIPLFKTFMPPEAKNLLNKTLYSGYLAEGKIAEKFRLELSKFIGNEFCVLTNSCTTAITIAMKICGVGPGTEVITTPLTCIAGNQPILTLGASPVWADISRKTGMITSETIEPLITQKTKAVYVLHKEGSPAEIEDIYKLKLKYKNLRIIEDGAHAFGAQRNKKKIGSMGDFVCFSFQAIKHITTGDGGAIFCNNKKDYQTAKKLKWFGVDRDKRNKRDIWREDISEWGFKGNMNDIASSIGLSQIKHINWILERCYENGKRYDEKFRNIKGIKTLLRDKLDYQTFWGYTILVENRKKVSDFLTKNGIQNGQIHVRNDLYSMFKKKTNLPNVDWFDQRELAIPTGWWVDRENQDFIIEKVKQAVL